MGSHTVNHIGQLQLEFFSSLTEKEKTYAYKRLAELRSRAGLYPKEEWLRHMEQVHLELDLMYNLPDNHLRSTGRTTDAVLRLIDLINTQQPYIVTIRTLNFNIRRRIEELISRFSHLRTNLHTTIIGLSGGFSNSGPVLFQPNSGGPTIYEHTFIE